MSPDQKTPQAVNKWLQMHRSIRRGNDWITVPLTLTPAAIDELFAYFSILSTQF
jgi:hypothetical protein